MTAGSYLADLPEKNVNVAYGNFAKGGDLGYENKRIIFGGKETTRSLSMHPGPRDRVSSVVYEVPRGATRLEAVVGLNDDIKHATTSLITFSVVAESNIENEVAQLIYGKISEGTTLWESRPLCRANETDQCHVNVGSCSQVRLVVHCDGGNLNAHAIWFEPYFAGEIELLSSSYYL